MAAPMYKRLISQLTDWVFICLLTYMGAVSGGLWAWVLTHDLQSVQENYERGLFYWLIAGPILDFGIIQTLFKQSVGKWVWGLRVDLRAGSVPKAGAPYPFLVKRFLLYPLAPFGWMHDRLAGTQVLTVGPKPLHKISEKAKVVPPAFKKAA